MSASQAITRRAEASRETYETRVHVSLSLDGTGAGTRTTGVGFLDHMLDLLARHGRLDLQVRTSGDLHTGAHHTAEDTAIVLGQAIRQALGDKVGLRRFADALIPLDEALAQCVVDVSGRPYCVCSGEPAGQEYVLIGGHFTGSLTRHVIETIATNAHLCVHMTLLAGRDPHHIAEAQFKALARALRDAVAIDPRETSVPSTKGTLEADAGGQA